MKIIRLDLLIREYRGGVLTSCALGEYKPLIFHDHLSSISTSRKAAKFAVTSLHLCKVHG